MRENRGFWHSYGRTKDRSRAPVAAPVSGSVARGVARPGSPGASRLSEGRESPSPGEAGAQESRVDRRRTKAAGHEHRIEKGPNCSGDVAKRGPGEFIHASHSCIWIGP